MAKSARYLTFEGQFESSVLGAFRIIRGFASLKDLAEVSVPYTMNDGDGEGQVCGQQRQTSPEHAERIRRYLEGGEQRFLPEVILSVRTELKDEFDQNSKQIGVKTTAEAGGISIGRAWKSKNIRVHRVKVERKKLEEIHEQKLIRRVDGNHRLALADQLKDDPHLPTKYLASFCIVLLGPVGNAADDYSESLIFHTINSTALPLESEHALKLILGQHKEYDMTPEKEFAFNPVLHFTRLLRDGLLKYPEPAQSRLGRRPLTSLSCAVREVIEMDTEVVKSLPALRKYSKELLSALDDIVTRLEPKHPALCKADFFIELAARVWKMMQDKGSHQDRVNATITFLELLSAWLGSDGWVNLKEHKSLSEQVLDIYNAVRMRIPKRVFLARWYPKPADGDDCEMAKLRLKQVKQTLKEIDREMGTQLELVDMGTQTGSTFPIHTKMYDAIASADIILIDLTGARPNVCVEAGFALRNHEKNRLIFMFQPTEANKAVPFDLNTFRYEIFKDTGEISEKIKPHINEILRGAMVGI
jgi:hypothetical protein